MLGFGFASAILTLVVVSILFVNFVGGMDGLAFMSKLNTVRGIVDELYVAEVDWDAAADKASAAIVQSAGDRWSYYMSAEEYAAYMDAVELPELIKD